MGAFFSTQTHVSIAYVGSSLVIPVGATVSLPFYIVELLQDAAFTSLEYRVVKTDGRTKTVINTWAVVPSSLTDVYTLEVLVEGLTDAQQLSIEFKLVDSTGVESYLAVPGFKTQV